MSGISVLIGGKAGDGINNAGMMVARILGRLGYCTYMYYDYPSLIRGGHNYAIVRAEDRPISAHNDRVDIILALNQETIDRHAGTCPACTVIANTDLVKRPGAGQGIPLLEILKAEGAPAIMGNSAMIGAFAGAAGIPFSLVEEVFRAHLPKGTEQNIRVARRAFDRVKPAHALPPTGRSALPLLSGNEAIGLGLADAGLGAYVSYPMTPSSSLLHFLAENARTLGITVIHPENEIAAVLMALGFSVAGVRSATGTSGGGFCLMAEGLSFAGMAELPVVLVVSQRTGPSTGLPTYTGQSDLRFVLHAGQGEFPRLVVAPGDAAEAYAWSAAALDLAWQFQVPAFILADKTLSEGTYSMDVSSVPALPEAKKPEPAGTGPYRRYAITESGVSPLAFPGTPGAVVKVNSYAHDESGITTEDAAIVTQMAEKRRRKAERLAAWIAGCPAVAVSGNTGAGTALVAWGSTKGAAEEVAAARGLRLVRPLVLSPFPKEQLTAALSGVSRTVVIEENATGQLAGLMREQGIAVHEEIHRYDGRPFTPDDLGARVAEMLAV